MKKPVTNRQKKIAALRDKRAVLLARSLEWVKTVSATASSGKTNTDTLMFKAGGDFTGIEKAFKDMKKLWIDFQDNPDR